MDSQCVRTSAGAQLASCLGHAQAIIHLASHIYGASLLPTLCQAQWGRQGQGRQCPSYQEAWRSDGEVRFILGQDEPPRG